MIVPQTFATHFARTLDLFRDPAAKEDQKVQFRALVEQLKRGGVTVTIDGGRVAVNGTPLEGEAYAALAQRLEFHSVRDIQIPAAPSARWGRTASNRRWRSWPGSCGPSSR